MYDVVYGIENLLNHKIYVGQTVRPRAKRLIEHKKSENSLIGRAIHKYGWECFTVVVLAEYEQKPAGIA